MTSEWSPPPGNGAVREDEVLRLRYERLCKERDRLREARGFFARPLGPAPASAAISTALVAIFAGHRHPKLLLLAAVALGLLVLVGMVYDGKPAYRHLYARLLADKSNAGWRERVQRRPTGFAR